MTSTIAALIEMTRSESARTLEQINEVITRWHQRHPGCEEFANQYRLTQSEIDRMISDDEVYEYVMVVNAKTEYKLLTGRNWTEE